MKNIVKKKCCYYYFYLNVLSRIGKIAIAEKADRIHNYLKQCTGKVSSEEVLAMLKGVRVCIHIIIFDNYADDDELF